MKNKAKSVYRGLLLAAVLTLNCPIEGAGADQVRRPETDSKAQQQGDEKTNRNASPVPEAHRVTETYSNGKLKFEGYKDQAGNKVSKWTYYYQNGHKEKEGRYKAGKETGTWKYYNEDGTLKEEKQSE